ncbi:alkaline phosphatase family protein [Halosegnis rubeus]|uniref:Nucleotide pyrophosphatase n=1 Tax=Halosegnis rubeus TaxID=2212850 RepID=A0A5N5UK00_9EURY|nr:alkaline phosphatase family protein [Halosegnis rubeus]KAB7517972.1 nucleotide pyrophosphatase [Halosegnis rubeus]
MDTLVFGLDGGEWDVINPMIEDGKLPNLESLISTGVSGPLKSITPPVSPPAWNSIQTGTNPGKHGVFDFSTFDDEYVRRSINTSDRQSTPFWRVMNDYDVSTGLFKTPFTYPPGQISGFIVTGFPTPSRANDFAKPESIVERVGPVQDLLEDWSYQQAGDYEAFKKDLIQVANHQTEVFLDLLNEYDTDLAMTVYDGSDRIQHFFWKYFDESHPRYEPNSQFSGAIEEYYQTVDEGLGRILETANPPCDVVVLSDHGFGPLSYDINIDQWLEKEGFLTRKSDDNPQKQATDIVALTLRASWDAIEKANIANQVKSILPSAWFEFGQQLQDDAHRDIEWDQTEAFFTTLSGQAIFVNLEERFVDGTVPQEEYEKIVSELQDSLLSMRHPQTNEKLVEEVIRSDEVFEGWALDDSPDLIIRSKPEYTMSGGRSNSLLRSSAQNGHDRSGDHRTDGIFVASGPSFSEGHYEQASVLDIAPTLLYLQECPVPSSVDGEVINSIFTDEAHSQRSLDYTDEYGRTDTEGRQWNADEEQELENRLNDMGYL